MLKCACSGGWWEVLLSASRGVVKVKLNFKDYKELLIWRTGTTNLPNGRTTNMADGDL